MILGYLDILTIPVPAVVYQAVRDLNYTLYVMNDEEVLLSF
jgi:hypothetical protein